MPESALDATPTPQRSDGLVMFGLTGDLGRKKLFPALYELAAAGVLDVPIIGVGRSEHSDDELREMFRDALADHAPADGSDVDWAIVDGVALRYLAGDSADAATFDELAARLDGAQAPLIYAALPPDLFGDVAAGIEASNLASGTRLVVEKPFGHDVESSQQLWNDITSRMPEDRLFIVDHFLAKSAVENIAVFRHANALIANSLDRDHVTAIDIEMSEQGDVDGRGSFYEGVGAINDVVQSHLLQTLALALMDPPDDSSADDFRRERSAMLAAVRPVDPATVVLGQYDGYREHDGVADDSRVETYVSMELAVDNDRWRGVPINIWTGKHLENTSTSVTFHLASPSNSPSTVPNRVRFEIKPTAAVALDISALNADTHEPEPVTVHACPPSRHGALGDYATMFDNALSGEQRHFATIDGIVEAWRIIEPITGADLELHPYAAGSSGPTATSPVIG